MSTVISSFLFCDYLLFLFARLPKFYLHLIPKKVKKKIYFLTLDHNNQ